MSLVDTASDLRLWTQLAVSPHTVLPILDSILQECQQDIIQKHGRPGPGQWNPILPSPSSLSSLPLSSDRPMALKLKCSARVMGLPAAESRRIKIPTSSDVGTFLSITATVIRTGLVKMLENSKRYHCFACKQPFEVLADVEQYNQVVMPTKCQVKGSTRPCLGTKFQMVDTPPGQMPEGCRDYQEIKIQEQSNKLAMGTIPRSMVVVLHDDLVDHAKSGDDVTITGTMIRRWKNPIVGERCDIELALLANHVFIHNEQRFGVGVTEEQRLEFEQFWEHHRDPAMNKPFTARNKFLSQICPKVYGLYIVKLAVMLILTGGVQKIDKSGLRVRGEPHLLLVGDPGTGKSQFLKYAAELNPRSVLTTGIGSSSAGLTVTAVRDGNEWQLEAGALVLADRGLCCIDEFGGMREHDKTAIHEAMEQQSISIAKAGIVCKLNTRCSVIAATNPKGKYDPDQSVSINIALASPLLSRFDIVLILMDTGNASWDQRISSYILETRMKMDGYVPKRAPHRKEIIRRRKRLERMRRLREAEGQGRAGSASSRDSHGREDREEAGADEDNDLEDYQDKDEETEEQDQDPWPIEKLKAYLIWIKTTFEPRLTPPAEQVLTAYYQLQRKADLRNAARTTIRLLESLIRLSQAHARMMAQDEVRVEDAVVIVSLMEATAQGGAALMGSINPLHASFPRNAEDEYLRQEEVMLGRLGLLHLRSRHVEGDGDDDGNVDDPAREYEREESERVNRADGIAGPSRKRRRASRSHSREEVEESDDNDDDREVTRSNGKVPARQWDSSPLLRPLSRLNGGEQEDESCSAVLNDQEEIAMLKRYQQEDIGSAQVVAETEDDTQGQEEGEDEDKMVEVKEEESLIDRRASRRNEWQREVQVLSVQNRSERKGKSVIREKSQAHEPSPARNATAKVVSSGYFESSSGLVEEGEDGRYPYELAATGQGSIEL
ncbi:DNA helicase mcm9 [Lunasporangiospora selenospora]|uniref:DNA helicase mcm9 n=1 Tax=Lunasporangiospora selenospora TaxID=979761 RepID=A0A9P6FSF9_9FUNG|nr:DNA helicase mcm9 [Lunasporangiospora selenospora]